MPTSYPARFFISLHSCASPLHDCSSFPKVHVASLALRQSTTISFGILLSGRRHQLTRRPRCPVPLGISASVLFSRACLLRSCALQFAFAPSQLLALLALTAQPHMEAVPPVFPSSLLPAFFGRGFLTTTGSSATLHHVFSPLPFSLFELTKSTWMI